VVLSPSPWATWASGSPAASRWTMRSRPMGVNRASLCLFTEPSGDCRLSGPSNPSLQRYGSVNNLLIN
jgi:hypothetical protein